MKENMKVFEDISPPLVLVFARASLHVQFLRNCLGSNHDIVESSTPQACLEMLNNLSVDFLIFDEKLVKGEVELFLTEVTSSTGYDRLPIIMISRNLKKQYFRDLNEVGLSGMLREPLDETEVFITLKKCDRRHQMEAKISMIATRIPKQSHNPEIEFKHRFLLNDKASKKIKSTLEKKQSLSLLMMEIDQFHVTTNGYEDSITEELLDTIEEKLTMELRPQDILIPLGGGKFMIILPKTSKTAARILAETVQSTIELEAFSLDGEYFHLTVSMGIASRKIEEMQASGAPMVQLNRLVALATGYVIESKHSGGQIIAEES
ncbi:MAG: diguanylate cyclase [Rhabdochlamydiaceae bacterium]|nr:diguanylate cyclase [Candidatus Amphrikana amoebophyrae]